MDAVAKLKVLFEADSSALDKSLGETDKKVGGLTDKMGGLSKAVGAGAVVGAAGLVSFGAAAVAAASDVAESQNKVNVVFGESAGAINDLAATAASKLGQTKGEVLEAAGGIGNLLTAMGQGKAEAAEMSIGMVKLAADLGSFNNASSTEVLEAMQAAMAGETDGMKKFGVAINDVTLSQAAMKAGLGDNVQALSAAQKQQLSWNIMLEQTASAQGDFANTSDGLANGMKIVKSSIADAVAEIGAGLLPAVQKAGAAFAEFLQSEKFAEIKDKIIAVFSAIGDKLASIDWGAIADMAVGLFEKLGAVIGFLADNPALGMVAAAIGIVVAAIAPLAAIIGPMIPIIMSIVGAFGSLGAVVGTIAALFNPVTLAIGAVVAVIVGLKLAWDNNLGGIQEKTAAVIEAVKTFFTGLVTKLGEVIAGAVQFVTDMGVKWEEFKTNIASKLQEIGDNITQKWEEFWTTITTKVQEIRDAVFNKWEEIKAAIGAALDFLRDALQKAWDAYVKLITDAMKAIYDFIKSTWDKIKEAVNAALEFVKGIIKEAWDWIVDYVTTSLENMKRVITDVFNSLKDAIQEAMRIVQQIFSDAFSHIRTLMQEWSDFLGGIIKSISQMLTGDFAGAFETLKQTVQDGIDAVVRFFAGMGQSIMTAIGDATTLLFKVGSDIIQGLMDGIARTWDTLATWLSGLFGDLIALAKKILGIASPSKVFAEIGASMADGLTLGFSDGLKRGIPGLERPIMEWIEKIREIIGGAVYDNPGFRGGGVYDGGWGTVGNEGPPMGAPQYRLPGGRGTGRVRADANRTGRGGFMAGSKSNYWEIWTQRHGVPEESSARKMADSLGIPLPQWLEDLYGSEGGAAKGLSPLESLVGEKGVLARVGDALEVFVGRVIGITPGGGGSIGVPGGGGKGPQPTDITTDGGAVTVTAGQVIVPNLQALITATIRPVIVIGNREIEAIAVQVDKILAERATLAVGP